MFSKTLNTSKDSYSREIFLSTENLKACKDIFEDEFLEPEILLFCKDDKRSLQLLNYMSALAKNNNINEIINFQDQPGENIESEIKYTFVKFFFKGIAYFKRTEYEESLKCFLEASKLHKYYQLYYNIGLCYLKLENLESAVYYFDTVTKENKNNIFAFYNLIRIFLKQKNYNDAYLLYHEFMEIHKKDNVNISSSSIPNRVSHSSSDSYLQLFYKIGAYCCFAKCLYQETIHTILEGLKFNQDDADLWCLYAKVFIVKKIYNYAIPLLEEALRIDPKHIESSQLLEIIGEIHSD